MVLRAPEGRYDLLRRGAMLVSMLHFATRPAACPDARGAGDRRDQPRPHPRTTTAGAWSRTSAASPGTASRPRSPPWSGRGRSWPGPAARPSRSRSWAPGRVGRHAVEFATKYGDDARNERLRPGRAARASRWSRRAATSPATPSTSRRAWLMTDLLVDATARRDPSVALVPNAWLALLPEHAVICDLSVDPYLLDAEPRIVRGHRGDPAGQPGPVGVRAGRSGLGRAAARRPHRRAAHGGVLLLVARRAAGAVHARLRVAAGAAARDARLGWRARRDRARTGRYHERALWRGSLRGWFASGEAGAHGAVAPEEPAAAADPVA